jgi:hypothetical protein
MIRESRMVKGVRTSKTKTGFFVIWQINWASLFQLDR